jgi:hypothetical protein
VAPGQALASVTNEFFDLHTSNLMAPQKRAAALVPALARHRHYSPRPDKSAR